MALEDVNKIPEESLYLGGICIPPQPQVVADLVIAAIDPMVKVEEIANIVAKDPGVAGSILKTVNSPFFGVKNTINNIAQAVSLLGVENVVNIANALAIREAMDNKSVVEMESFWEVTTKTAHIATTLSKKFGLSTADKAYCLGLFHNCGIALLLKKHQNYFTVLSEAYQLADGRLVDTENRYFSSNHAVVGKYVAKAWRLSQVMADVIGDHHSVGKYFGTHADNLNADSHNEHKDLIAILKMSEYFAKNYEVLGHQVQDLEWEEFGEAILEYVGASEDDFFELKEQFGIFD